MANKIGWALVRAPKEEALRALCAKPVGEAPGDDLDVHQSGEWTSLRWHGWDFDRIYTVGRLVSGAGPSIAFFVFEGSWMFRIHRGGQLLAEREHLESAHPTLYGDLDAAESALGLPAGTLKAWNLGDPIGDYQQENLPSSVEKLLLDTIEACPMKLDGHDVDDEWGFLGLAERLGVQWTDEPGERYAVEVDCPREEGLPVAHVFDPVEARRARLSLTHRAKLWALARAYKLRPGD